MIKFINVQLVYAQKKRIWKKVYRLPPGTNVEQLIQLSTIIKDNPALSKNRLNVGVYGKPCTLNTILYDGDRIEIYRPIQCDPKLARKRNIFKTHSRLSLKS